MRFSSMKYFKRKKEVVVCLYTKITIMNEEEYVYTEYYITEQRSIGCSLPRHSNNIARNFFFLQKDLKTEIFNQIKPPSSVR